MFRSAIDCGAAQLGDVRRVVGVIAVAMTKEDGFRFHVHQILNRGRYVRTLVGETINVGIEKEHSTPGGHGERRDAKPGEDDLVLADLAGLLVHVLGAEEVLARLDESREGRMVDTVILGVIFEELPARLVVVIVVAVRRE